MNAPAVNETWKWLFEPLSPKMRCRLELCFGVVVTGAAMVALASVIPPDPSRLAAMTAVPMATPALERSADSDLRVVPAPPPKVSPEFAKAVSGGDVDTMQRLYTQGMPFDGMLAVAAEAGQKNAVTWLLGHGADVTEDESTVDAPVLAADDHPDILAILFEAHAPETTLVLAAQANAPNAVGRLLAAHAPVDSPDGNPLAAAVASTRGSAETRQSIVSQLLAAGANPNRADESALTAAVRTCDPTSDDAYLAAGDCLTMIDLLVKHGARTQGDTLVSAIGLDNPAGDTVFDAVVAGHLERGATAIALSQVWNMPARATKQLVAKGVDWSWHDGEDDAALPLLAAIQHGDRDYVRALLDAGAPVDAHFKDASSTLGAAIDGAATGSSAEFARIVELLLARGADVNRRLPDGRTPLYAAAEGGELRIVTALLDRGARVNDLVLDSTALDAAEQGGHLPAARLVHARGGRRGRIAPLAQGDGNQAVIPAR